MKKISEILTVFALCVPIILFSALHVILPDKILSESERRSLASFPKFTFETATDGIFMQNLEKYLPDQFPFRDGFRGIKAIFELSNARLDVNDIYYRKGHLAKLDYEYSKSGIIKTAEKLERVRNVLCSENTHTYFAMIPPKNNYMRDLPYPSADYEAIEEFITAKLDGFTRIKISDTLELSDYYKTDSHWREECLYDTVERIKSVMGINAAAPKYEVKEIKGYYGVYAGQSALPIPSESIFYLTSPAIEAASVSDIEGKVNSVYTTDRIQNPESLDMYDIYLGGAVAVTEITNNMSGNYRTLTVIRDSYGSSIIPLLIEYYHKITAVDLRYISLKHLPNYIDIPSDDVLFIFSAGIVGNSEILKIE